MGRLYLFLDGEGQERYDPVMARIARVVAPGGAHRVTQRGNRRQQTFFCDDDYRAYLELMVQWCSRCAWAGEGTEPKASQAKAGTNAQKVKQISIVPPEINWE